MNYTEPGNIYTSLYGAGGYIFYLSNDIDEAWNIVRKEFYEEDFLYHGVNFYKYINSI